MKVINVRKPIAVPRWTNFPGWLFLAIASVLQKLNAGYNDYDIRLHMGELTQDEARAEIREDIANEERNRLTGEFWNGG